VQSNFIPFINLFNITATEEYKDTMNESGQYVLKAGVHVSMIVLTKRIILCHNIRCKKTFRVHEEPITSGFVISRNS
jgi:hypothetical protein